MTVTQPDLVLLLRGRYDLADVAVLSRCPGAPTVFSVTLSGSDHRLRGILATEAQMVELRDVLDSAVEAARTIERGRR